MTAAVSNAPAQALAGWRRKAAGLPDQGVYDNMPSEDYHRTPALSASGMGKLLAPGCPALYRYERDNPQPPSKVFDFGHAAHRLVLGAGEEIEVIDAPDYKSVEARADRDWARSQGLIPMLPDEFAKAKAMAEELRRHPLASALFQGGRPEQSLFWNDPRTGVPLRARLDWLSDKSATRLVIADYKGLALDTPIPTPLGWTTMRMLQVGDQVFDSEGQPCTVVQKSDVHMRRCYRIRFDDGSSVVCDDEHLWVTTAGRKTRPRTHVPTVRTTEEIRGTLKLYGQSQHRVAVAQSLALPEVVLPIHPYVLGCWLGDGTAAAARITNPEDDLFDLIAQCGYKVGAPWPSARCQTRTIHGLSKQLRLAGLLGNKHVPHAYLRASGPQRLELLQGLMDTDGSWNSTRQQAVHTTVDKAMAESVRELACSLGQRAVLHETQQTGFGLKVTAYQVAFTPTRGLNPFKLARKANQVAVRSETRSLQRVIVAVEEMPTIPTQCIAVNSPSRTYLCTEAMIPTHNTITAVDLDTIEKSIAKYNYHVQNAQYVEGAIRLNLGDEDTAMVFVFQMKSPPFLVHAVQLDMDTANIGRAKRLAAIDLYRDCAEAGHWPGYDNTTYASLPAWAEKRDEEYL